MSNEKQELTKQQIFAELTRSPHGKLEEYLPVGKKAAKQDDDFFAHLVAWNNRKGEIRDAKVALPVIALSGTDDAELRENALAHIAGLDPLMLTKSLDFAHQVVKPKNSRKLLYRLVERYLRDTEADRKEWNHRAVQHKASMKRLYSWYHVKPASWANAILFESIFPPGSVFEAIANLKHMSPLDAAAAISHHNIPFLVLKGALGSKLKDTDTVLAMIQSMSGPELINSTKWLEKLGVRSVPALRAAYDEALTKATKKTAKTSTLKATKAAEVVTDKVLALKLKQAQEHQINNLSIEGDWLVLVDKSGSMSDAIKAGQEIAAILARAARGKVYLVFFDTTPYFHDVSGKTYEDIVGLTRRVKADGGTSIGVGLNYLLERKIQIDGIAIVTDGGENTVPFFRSVYERYSKQFDKEAPIYNYLVGIGTSDDYLKGIEHQTFNLGYNVDYYSLPNLVKTMRTNRYSMVDEIMAMPLLTLDKVLKRTTDLEVLPHAAKIKV